MYFQIDLNASIVALILIILFLVINKFLLKQIRRPHWKFSHLQHLTLQSWKMKYVDYPKKIHYLAFAFFLLAFLDPHFVGEQKQQQKASLKKTLQMPTDGIAIYLVLDRSGSMAENAQVSDKNIKNISKFELLKTVTQAFILEHSTDLIGLIAFARVPQVVVPLTLDQSALLNKLSQLEIVKSQDSDGTALGYAIFKAIHLLDATRHFSRQKSVEKLSPYEIKGSVIIAVTDGVQDPSYLDEGNRLRTIELEEVGKLAKEQHIPLYIININPKFASGEFAPHRRQQQKITKETGGNFYLITHPGELREIYVQIDQIEKGKIYKQQVPLLGSNHKREYRVGNFDFYLIGMGLICLFCALFLEECILRRIP